VTAPDDATALAAVGGLAGDDLATHLGVASLEEHAAKFVKPDDHPDNRPDYVTASEHTVALTAWLDKPAFTAAMRVGDATFWTCDHCAVLVGAQELHVEQHRRLGT